MKRKLTVFIFLFIFTAAGCKPDAIERLSNPAPGAEENTDAPEKNAAADKPGMADKPGTTDNPGGAVSAGKIISVSAGNNHTMALDDNGNVWAWGDNYCGQVGDGNISTYFDPIYEELPEDEEYAEMLDGRVRDIDNDVYAPKYIMGNVRAVYAREDSSFAITNDDKLYAWGYNEHYQLCDGTAENKSSPTFIMDDVLYVDSGNNQTTIIVKTDHTLWAAGRRFGWGWECYETPALLYENVKKAAFDGNNPTGLLILTDDNRLISYVPAGLNTGHEDYENFIFTEMYNIEGVTDISCISQQVYMLNASGDVYGFGANGSDGRLGAMGEEFWVYEPVFIASGVKRILNGPMFIKNDGALLTWGTIMGIEDFRDSNGSQGGGALTGDIIAYGKTPVVILGNIAEADGRRSHRIAVDNDGNVYTWGQNFNGQLGNGNAADQTAPARIVFP